MMPMVAQADLATSAVKVKAGDKVVVLRDTHVQAGTEKLAPVQAGTELVAEDVNGEWTAVTVKVEGREIDRHEPCAFLFGLAGAVKSPDL